MVYLSNVNGIPLNTDATTDAATAYYGPIMHPTIEDIAVMVDHFWKEASARDPSLRYEDLRLWNMDLKETSTLQSFRAEYVGQTIWSICNSPTYSVDPAHRPPSK